MEGRDVPVGEGGHKPGVREFPENAVLEGKEVADVLQDGLPRRAGDDAHPDGRAGHHHFHHLKGAQGDFHHQVVGVGGMEGRPFSGPGGDRRPSRREHEPHGDGGDGLPEGEKEVRRPDHRVLGGDVTGILPMGIGAEPVGGLYLVSDDDFGAPLGLDGEGSAAQAEGEGAPAPVGDGQVGEEGGGAEGEAQVQGGLGQAGSFHPHLGPMGFGVVNGHVVLQADAVCLGRRWPQDGTDHNGYCQEQSPHSKPPCLGARRPTLTLAYRLMG